MPPVDPQAVDSHPAEGQPPAVQAGFALLRARFLGGLPGRWQEIVASPPGPVRQAALHRLAGAAGSYGLGALGEAARRAEAACVDATHPGTSAARPPAPDPAPDETLAQLRLQIEAAGVTLS